MLLRMQTFIGRLGPGKRIKHYCKYIVKDDDDDDDEYDDKMAAVCL